MNRLNPDLVQYLAEQAILGVASEVVERDEFFGSSHIRTIMKDFSYPTYHPQHFFLFLLSRQMQPDFILELGVEVGRGLASMHMGCPDAPIVGVDILDVSHNCKQSMEPFAVPGRWRLVHGDSLKFAEEAPDQVISLVHIDSNHEFEQTKKEYDTYRPRMKVGGVMVFDDACLSDVAGVWGLLIEGEPYNHKMLFPDLHKGAGMGVVICNMGRGEGE